MMVNIPSVLIIGTFGFRICFVFRASYFEFAGQVETREKNHYACGLFG